MKAGRIDLFTVVALLCSLSTGCKADENGGTTPDPGPSSQAPAPMEHGQLLRVRSDGRVEFRGKAVPECTATQCGVLPLESGLPVGITADRDTPAPSVLGFARRLRASHGGVIGLCWSSRSAARCERFLEMGLPAANGPDLLAIEVGPSGVARHQGMEIGSCATGVETSCAALTAAFEDLPANRAIGILSTAAVRWEEFAAVATAIPDDLDVEVLVQQPEDGPPAPQRRAK